MDDRRGLRSLAVALAAAIATIVALSWRAAEHGRGLDLIDVRAVVIVTTIVLAAAAWLGRRPGKA